MTVTREEWRPVLGYEGYYEVSDQGRVRSTDRVVVDLGGRRHRMFKGRVLVPKPNHGRHHVILSRGNVQATRPVHILVLEAFIGPRPHGMAGCHNNGDALDNRVGNLRWDTWSENTLDQVRHGVHAEAAKTHCPRSHPLAEPNLIRSHQKRGMRNCLACHRAAAAQSRAVQKGEPFDMQYESDRYYAAGSSSAPHQGEPDAYQDSAQLKG